MLFPLFQEVVGEVEEGGVARCCGESPLAKMGLIAVEVEEEEMARGIFREGPIADGAEAERVDVGVDTPIGREDEVAPQVGLHGADREGVEEGEEFGGPVGCEVVFDVAVIPERIGELGVEGEPGALRLEGPRGEVARLVGLPKEGR